MKSFVLPMRLLTMLCVVALILLSSCSNNSKRVLQEVRDEVAEINTQCPIDMGMAGLVTGVSLDEAGSTIQYMLQPSDLILNETVFVSNEALLKKSLLLNMSPFEVEQSGAVELADAGYNMAYIYSFPSGKKYTLTLTSEDIKKAYDEKMSPAERAEALLETRCELSRLMFPTAVDPCTTQIGVELGKDQIIHQFSIDEDGLGVTIDDPLVSKDALYESIVEGLKANKNDPAMRSEMQALIATGRGMLYHYTGAKSGAELEIEVTPEVIMTLFR